MSLKEQSKNDEETVLNITTVEPLEMDDTYSKPTDIRWGKCIPLCFSHGYPRVVLGPHWPLFICAFLVFFGVSVGLVIWEARKGSTLVFWSTVAVCVNQCLSYAWVALVNPGVANSENAQIKNQDTISKLAWYCDKCKLVQLRRTVHCYDCDVCVMEMDHHCPWTGKCIGKGNIKQFYYFLGSTLVFMVFNIVISLSQIDTRHIK